MEKKVDDEMEAARGWKATLKERKGKNLNWSWALYRGYHRGFRV